MLVAAPPLARAQQISFPSTPAQTLHGVIATKETGFLVGRPNMIAGPGVDRVIASPDGRWVLAARMARRLSAQALISGKPADAPGETSLILWDARTEKTTVIWRRRLNAGESATVTLLYRGWLAGGNQAVASVFTQTPGPDGKPVSESRVLRIDLFRAAARETVLTPDAEIFTNSSPTQPFVALVSAEGSAKESIRFLRADGSLTKPIPLPGLVWFTRWSPDGAVLRGVWHRQAEDGKTVEEWVSVNPRTQTVSPIPAPPPGKNGERDYGGDDRRAPADDQSPLRLVARGSKGDTSVWLESKDGKSALNLAPAGEPVALSSRGALFRWADALYAAPLEAIRPATLAQITQAAEQQETLRRARRISAVLRVYASDNAKTLPPPGADLTALLGPTLTLLQEDKGLLAGFTYTPPETRVWGSIRDAATTPLGFVKAAGGRAVAYADGHIAWQKDPE